MFQSPVLLTDQSTPASNDFQQNTDSTSLDDFFSTDSSRFVSIQNNDAVSFQPETNDLIRQYPNEVLLTPLGNLNLPVVLALVMLAAAASMLLKHWRDTRFAQGGMHRSLRILETIRLGSRGSLMLVACAESQALVACDMQGIRSVVVLPNAFPSELLEQGQQLPFIQADISDIQNSQLPVSLDTLSLWPGRQG